MSSGTSMNQSARRRVEFPPLNCYTPAFTLDAATLSSALGKASPRIWIAVGAGCGRYDRDGQRTERDARRCRGCAKDVIIFPDGRW
jgi:hypothetical protein